jgi:hypothetical protein
MSVLTEAKRNKVWFPAPEKAVLVQEGSDIQSMTIALIKRNSEGHERWKMKEHKTWSMSLEKAF